MKTDVEKTIEIIAEALSPRKIFLFGSRTRGDHNPESDVDLLIIHDGPEPKREIKLRVHKLFAGRGLSLDIMVLTSGEMERTRTVANTLAREVSEMGIVCYG